CQLQCRHVLYTHFTRHPGSTPKMANQRQREYRPGPIAFAMNGEWIEYREPAQVIARLYKDLINIEPGHTRCMSRLYRTGAVAVYNNQCLKWRMPVITMARPFAWQYSMESLSRMLPPG